MGSPRLDVVFCLWQCDKKNHGWCEGPPVTVLCQSFRSAGRAFTLRLNQFRTKKEYSFTLLPASLSLKHWPVIADDSPGGARLGFPQPPYLRSSVGISNEMPTVRP
jgi:hypothetical protein